MTTNATSSKVIEAPSCSETANSSKPQQPGGHPAELAPNSNTPGVSGTERTDPIPSHQFEAADTSDKRELVLHEERRDKHYPNLFRTEETSHSEQGIDLTAFPELNKPVKKLMTPSGVKDVICFMNTDDADIVPPYEDFVPHYRMPEMGYVWSRRFETSLGAGNFVPEWSPRTTELLKYCQFFHGGCLVRLICKVPLVVSQAFWVFRTSVTDVTNTFTNQIGFMWKPSVQNEVFVLMPWASLNVFNIYNTPLDQAFLRLGIQPVSRLLSEPGTASSLGISAYFAPYNIVQAVPRPVLRTTGNLVSQLLSTYTGNIGTSFPLTLGTISLDGNALVSIANFEASTGANDSARYEFRLNGQDLYTGDLNDNTGPNDFKSNTSQLNLTAGSYTLTIEGNGDGFPNSDIQVLNASIVSLGASGSWTPANFKRGRREIFEYSYNTRSEAGAKIYGAIGDHSTVEDTHWQLITPEIEITDANKYVPINISIPLYSTGNFPPFATREVSRHLLKARYPGIKLVTVKTPFSNLLARVTMSILTNSEETMQLPGKEWDLNGELRFEPYWDYFNPAIADPVLNLTIDILNASVATVGASIVVYLNTSSLEYYHFRPYNNDPATVTAKFIETGSREMEVIHENEGIHNTSRPENLSLMTDPQSQKTDLTETRIGDIAHYVGSYDFDLATTKFVAFAINHNLFPQAIVNTAKKAQLWHGTPKFRLHFTTNVTQAAQVFVAHVDQDFDFTAAAAEAIRMYPSTCSSVRNNIVEINCGWRQYEGSIFQNVDYTTARPPQLGYLVIAIPLRSATLGALDSNVKVAIYCDTAGFTYRNQLNLYTDFSYPGPAPIIVPVTTADVLKDVTNLVSDIPVSFGLGGP